MNQHFFKIILVFFLTFYIPGISIADNNTQAKLEYLTAEEFAKSGNNDEAIKRLEKVIELLGNTNPRIQILLTQVCFSKEDFERAKKEVEKYFDITPSSNSKLQQYQDMMKLRAQIEVFLTKKRQEIADRQKEEQQAVKKREKIERQKKDINGVWQLEALESKVYDYNWPFSKTNSLINIEQNGHNITIYAENKDFVSNYRNYHFKGTFKNGNLVVGAFNNKYNIKAELNDSGSTFTGRVSCYLDFQWNNAQLKIHRKND